MSFSSSSRYYKLLSRSSFYNNYNTKLSSFSSYSSLPTSYSSFSLSFQSRSFSSTTRTPPSVWGSSGKTATSLFQSAQKTNTVSSLGEELRSFQKSYESNYSLKVAFFNPLLKGEKRQQLLNNLFPRLKITNPLAKDLIKNLVDSRGLNKLKKILVDFEKLASFARNEVHAKVTSAEPLSNEQLGKLQEALKKRIGANEKLVLETRVDPAILGGLKIFLDNKMLDLSAAARIKAIDRALRGKA